MGTSINSFSFDTNRSMSKNLSQAIPVAAVVVNKIVKDKEMLAQNSAMRKDCQILDNMRDSFIINANAMQPIQDIADDYQRKATTYSENNSHFDKLYKSDSKGKSIMSFFTTVVPKMGLKAKNSAQEAV